MLFWLLALAMQTPADIRTTVPLVLVPVHVTDAKGKLVHGLEEDGFTVSDGGVVREHRLEVSSQPVSLVLAVQSNHAAGPALAKLRKVGSMVMPLLAGGTGRAAVLTYSDAVTLRLPFSRDPDALSGVFAGLLPDGTGSRMLDAVDAAFDLLDQAPPDHRRILILVGETRDRSSDRTLDDLLRRAAGRNVMVYAVGYSVHLTPFTSRGQETVKDQKTKKEVRVVQPGTPNLIGGLGELARLGRPNAAEALARATGGARFSFLRLAGLQEAIQALSEDLHNQYLLTFSPAPGAPGYREIRVAVRGRPELTVRARPGYWTGPNE